MTATWRPQPVPITGALRARINTLAHAAGQRHAIEVRDRLIAELRTLAGSGARLPELNARLDQEQAQ